MLARVSMNVARRSTAASAGLLPRLAAVAPASALMQRRHLCIHDDFKPQKKRAYASEADGVQEQIAKDVEANKVVLYMKGVPDAPMCGFSNAVVQVLKAENTEFVAYNVLADPDLREGIKTFSAWPTIPQVYVNGEFIGGCDTTMEMYKSGVRAPPVPPVESAEADV
jgi:monothiol glutaredoxin